MTATRYVVVRSLTDHVTPRGEFRPAGAECAMQRGLAEKLAARGQVTILGPARRELAARADDRIIVKEGGR